MRNEETGEFELVLGNRQVLSGFFIIAILFAVFFAMGYIVGRNSAPMKPEMAADTTAPVERPAFGSQPAAEPPAQGPSEPVSTPAPAETQPAATTPAAEVPPPQIEAKPAPKVEDPKPPVEPIPIKSTPGRTYLQVMAVKRPDAELVAGTLRKKGFPAVLGPGPNELYRVLVGPYADTASLGKAKADLEAAGFKPFVQK